jgi:hypothetical protein
MSSNENGCSRDRHDQTSEESCCCPLTGGVATGDCCAIKFDATNSITLDRGNAWIADRIFIGTPGTIT